MLIVGRGCDHQREGFNYMPRNGLLHSSPPVYIKDANTYIYQVLRVGLDYNIQSLLGLNFEEDQLRTRIQQSSPS